MGGVEGCAHLRASVSDGSVLRLSGDFDHDDVDTFRDAVRALAPAPAPVVIDVADLTFLGCPGLRALLDERRRRDGLTLRAPSRRVRRLLELAGAEELIDHA